MTSSSLCPARASHVTTRTVLLAALLIICACNGESNGTDAGGPTRSWHVMQEGLAGVVLSVWGTSSKDVWIAGADGGSGGLAAHFDGSSWEMLDAGAGDLWWVFGPDSETVWFVGAKGRVLRHKRSDKSFTTIDTTVKDATLFGIWGPPAGPWYAVGGHIPPAMGPPVALRIEGDTATEVQDLPAGLVDNEVFFKVWGTSADDVWIISDKGSVLHLENSTWSRQALPDNPRLITVHGSSDDMVIVGGLSNAVIFERTGNKWEEVAPPYLPSLNGVFVTPEGKAFASGFSGLTLERTNGIWTQLPKGPKSQDWHGAWIDDNGDYYAAGGDFFNLSDGAVYRYGL